jgi:tape measure domain-containing protein
VTISTLTIWGKKLIDVAGELELLRIRLNAVEGSAKAGDKQFKALFTRFKDVPFQLDAITDGFVRLRAAGISTKDANRTIDNLVDAIAVFGGSTAELQRATIGFQQVAGKGVLSMEELRQQIGESIPSAMAIMSRAAGITIGEFVERVKNGTISAAEAFRLFNEEAERQFGGFAKTLEFTIVGSIQGLKSKIRFEIGELFNVRTDLGARVTAFIKVITERIVRFIQAIDQADVERFWKSFEGVALVVEGVGRAIKFLAETLFLIFGIIGNATGTTGGKVIIGGIIGQMLFGTKGSIITGTLIAINEELRKTGKEIINISKITDLGAAGGIERGRVVRELLPSLFKKKDVRTISFRDFQTKDIAAAFPDDFVGASAAPRTPSQLFEDFLAKAIAARDRESPKGKGGLLGLSGEFGRLSEEMLTLSNRAKIAADNTLTPWLKVSDSFNLKFAEISKGVKRLENDFEIAAKAMQEEIDVLRAGGELERAKEKEIELEEARANKIKQTATLQKQFKEAEIALQKRANDLSTDFLDKQVIKLQEVQNAADLALGRASPFQIGLREIGQEADRQIPALEKIRDGLFRVIVKSEDLSLVGRAVQLYNELGQAIEDLGPKSLAAGRNLTILGNQARLTT